MNNNTNTWNREKYIEAWNYASLRHSGQKYGGHQQDLYMDYLTHLGMVSMEIIWALDNSEVEYKADLAIQCAILHDTIEDTGLSHQELSASFGKEVADGVLALSKNSELGSKILQMEDSLRRIKMQAPEIWMVKMADRISNLYLSPFYWDNEKKKQYKTEAQMIYDALHEANSLLAERLRNKIITYQVD